MSLFENLAISASGMTAGRLWLDLISNNIANLNTAGRPGDPGRPAYRRLMPVFAEELRLARQGGESLRGVAVSQVRQDPAPPRLVYEPGHPLADARGYVEYPNINIANEMTDLLVAARFYEANATVFNAAKGMAVKALELGR